MPIGSAQIEGLDELRDMLSPDFINQVLKYTTQELASQTGVQIKKKIKEGYNIKPSDLNKAMKVKGVSVNNSAILQFKDEDSRGVNIYKMSGGKASQNAVGVVAEFMKGKPTLYPQAFIMKVGSWMGVVIRKKEGGVGKRGQPYKGGRGPRHVHGIYGARITQLVASDYMLMQVINKFVSENAQRIFNQKLNWKTKGMISVLTNTDV